MTIEQISRTHGKEHVKTSTSLKVVENSNLYPKLVFITMRKAAFCFVGNAETGKPEQKPLYIKS